MKSKYTDMRKLVIIDNGHGSDTSGKRSPDGRLREWQWTRIIARHLAEALTKNGIDSIIIVPEDTDIPLHVRCRRANAITADNPGAILLSLHSNASTDGGTWGNAAGWSAFIANNASAASEALASALFRQAAEARILGNRVTPACGFNRASLAICRNTHCPAVLTENMFHDNRGDVDFMLSAEGIATIVQVHAKGIADYFSQQR